MAENDHLRRITKEIIRIKSLPVIDIELLDFWTAQVNLFFLTQPESEPENEEPPEPCSQPADRHEE